MAQQVGKRYRLLKNAPNAKKDTIVTYDHEYGMYSYSGISGQLSDPMFYKEEVEGNPDWFEEVKDDPFDCAFGGIDKHKWNELLKRFEYTFYSTKAIQLGDVKPICAAIEDIVNGVDEKDKCLFDADKINARLRELELDQLQREAFEAGRQDHPYKSTYEYSDYEDYKNRKK